MVVERSHPSLPWDLGLSAWIIEDGSFLDFEVGQIAEFAVQFWSTEGVLEAPPHARVSATLVGDNLYDTVAEVVFHNERITVLDIGIRCYGDALRFPVSPGARIALRLHLLVDAFAMFEAPDHTPLVYTWKVQSILMQTAPLIEDGPRVLVRDPQRLGYKEVSRTDAWKDDGGNGSYILRCELLPVAPKKTSSTAL